MTLRRGFKAEAERKAVEIRTALGLKSHEPVDLRAVAHTKGVAIVLASDLVEVSRLEEIERLQAYAFSACTFEIKERLFIVVNPLHSENRQNSDIAHELAHVILEHKLTEIRELAGTPFRTCMADQEEEANTFAGTLLLPRPLLIKTAKVGKSWEDLVDQYSVTTSMARYRWNATGVARQIASAGSGQA